MKNRDKKRVAHIGWMPFWWGNKFNKRLHQRDQDRSSETNMTTMTDNEIIKALKCCEDSRDTDKHCLKCPYCNESYCLDKMMADALSLINRQKAEIERLNNEVDNVNHDYILLCSDIAQNRAEAIKEFAERLKEKGCYVTAWSTKNRNCLIDDQDIDNLVKEMVGDGDG